MNAVMMCCYNTTPKQLELTKQAVASVLAQDIPVDLFLIDNGSTEETWAWMQSIREPSVCKHRNLVNVSPVRVVNTWMAELLDRMKYEYVLGAPNDVFIPPNLYREMLRWPRGLVTASMTGEKISYGGLLAPQPSHAVNTCTPMAVALIRKWFHDALVAKDGYFLDPGYFHYASDCDMALRMAACGITGVQLDTQYWHSGSASWRMATPEAAKEITDQADKDRDYFVRKWGFPVNSPLYGERAGDINFRGERVDG